jgi:hypothetical protein
LWPTTVEEESGGAPWRGCSGGAGSSAPRPGVR